ncbi:MAG: hypothetical protein JKX73_11285, partial [Flavobacteriales bacterium]|nr:hypothetical protein [Flavobacteriales bacterium]
MFTNYRNIAIALFTLPFGGSIQISAQIQPPAGIGDSTDIIMWLSPDTAVYNSTGNVAAPGETVYEWQDISKNNVLFENTLNNRRPVYGNVNGRGYLNFTPGDFLENTAIANVINGLNEFSIFVVIKSNVTNTDNGFLYWKNPPDNQDDGLCMRYDAAGWWTGGTNLIKAGLMGNS